MDYISLNQFRYAQPNGSIEHETNDFYLSLANELIDIWNKSNILSEITAKVKQAVALGLIGYYQDIISDMGIWRTFISECKRMYGKYVPFYSDSEDYIEYELNLADVKFLTWYFIAFNTMEHRFIYPLSDDIQNLGQIFFDKLNHEYDDAPTPHHFREILDFELYDPESKEAVYDFSQWLFWHNYMIVPPFQLSYSQIYFSIEEINNSIEPENIKQEKIEELKREAMSQLPTGPLALYLKEWLHLIIENKYPPQKRSNKEEIAEHKYFTAFTKATDGSIIKFIKTYDELNRFFIDAMNWGDGKHLAFLKNDSDFVLFVNREKGMIVAKNIARSINHPENHLYDKQYAQENAFKIVSERMACPGDLLRYICENGYLPDAKFPNTSDTEIVKENWDFISRTYLQEYYRGD